MTNQVNRFRCNFIEVSPIFSCKGLNSVRFCHEIHSKSGKGKINDMTAFKGKFHGIPDSMIKGIAMNKYCRLKRRIHKGDSLFLVKLR
jgi:hypothetical protein